jgi:UDP-N-acetylmuramoyl-L-alanyl-D-glutamate--2,6-diaminopimelate ligase
MGRFMAANAALAIVMLVEGGHRFDVIAQVLERDGGFDVVIPGRAEIVSGELGPVVYVDYGHTPDAFEGLLTSLRAVTPGKVFMVFGADGDRDATKRHAMGAIAARGADVVIITDFHPRTEDPAVIRQALLSGARSVNSAAEIIEEADPQRAMRLAIRLATDADAILYAGPGHENYREVNGVHLDYNAREDVRAALREAGLPPLGEN